MTTDKQLEVQIYLKKVKCATIEQIYENVSFYYYCNANKHLGALLSRMVKSGKIARVQKGLFMYIDAKTYLDNRMKEIHNPNQLKLV